MKKLILFFLLLPALCFGQQNNVLISFVGSSDECADYLVCQNFEGVGYDNSETWTESSIDGGSPTINEDYTGTVLRGTESLLIVGDDYKYGRSGPTFTGQSDLYTHFMYRAEDLTTNNNTFIFFITDSSDNELAKIQFRTNGQIYFVSGGQTDFSVTTIVADTTYHIWVDYHKGTGADSSAEIYFGTTATKPGVASGSVTGGNATADAAKVFCQATWDINNYFDQVLAKSTEFSSVPE